MKCHYEVLNIPRDADDSEIKTAYRKLALKWHPDKNLDNPELAKEQFQIVQQAYEVLSDRQERAWYDNHREQILRGASNTNFTDDSLDVFPYFTTSCFKGYEDDENGFYTVYRKVFEKIASEDIEYMDSEQEFDEIPLFGDSKSDYENVVGPFYAYWMSYSTKKSYVWLDPYDIRETRERRVLKLIEKENKKVRAKAKKERNEEVRNLVAFVRKRDKRVKAHSKLLEERNLENRKKQEAIRHKKILERKQELHKAKENEQEWSKFENMSSELKEIEKHLAAEFGEELSESELSDINDSESMDDLYCVACNKVFKTINAFDNHETSKKHRENVELLKKQMSLEDNTETATNGNTVELNSDENENSIIEDNDKSKSPKKNKKKQAKVVISTHSEDESNEKNDFIDIGLSKKQKKKNFREQQILASKKDRIETNSSKKASNKKNGNQGDNNCEENEQAQNDNSEKRDRNIVMSKKKQQKSTDNVDLTHCCVMCKSNFASKNKLFDHLKKTGHSVALPASAVTNSNENKRKKRIK